MNLTLDQFNKWMINFQRQINGHREYLNEVDSKIGDGDHGDNMVKGIDAAIDALNNQKDYNLTEALKIVSNAFLKDGCGAAAVLYGNAFLYMSKRSVDTSEIGDLLTAGTQGIQKRGNTQAEDKTMYDVWLPLSQAVKNDELSRNLIKSTVDTTKDMVATKGRAAALGKRSKGYVDSGAVSSGYLFCALLDMEDI